ncbi:MAG TPA: HAMP domain-containing sensor histidine kinase [Pseudonocardiaceae bacterium]|nr:HAMP domain-containing sensor histidine kinase [Pseudonocardiaceae bacterium]
MRRRLLVVLLMFATVAVTGFAWPLLSSTAAERSQRLLLDRTGVLDRFAVLAQQAAATGDHSPLAEEATAYADLYGESVLILDRQRRLMVAAGGITPDDPGLRPLIDGALRNEPGQPLPHLRPWSDGEVVLARPVGTGSRIAGVAVLRTSLDAAAADVARSWALILGGALAAAVSFVLLALVLARWVLRPLAELERGVLAVAAGGPGAHVAAGGGPAELRALTTSFNQMSDAVAAAAEQERQLVADASHQLRNPMAALRLRVDSLAPRLPAAAQDGYRSLAAEVERLEALLDGLLTLASADRVAAEPDPADDARCRPGAVAGARLDAWRPAASQAEVRLVNGLPAEPAAVACADSELAQILDILLDNAIRYAGPGATVTVGATIYPDTVRLIVADDGPGLSTQDRAQARQRFWRAARHRDSTGTGLGLAIAERLLLSRKGALYATASDSGGLAVHVVLPRAEKPEAGP